jgi:hypothetical protein
VEKWRKRYLVIEAAGDSPIRSKNGVKVQLKGLDDKSYRDNNSPREMN